MSRISVTVRGNGIKRLSEAVEALGEKKARAAYRMAVNDAGGKTKTKTGQALAKQTGLKVSVTRRALRPSKASDADLAYSLRGDGGNISLKFFGPRETEAGVSAAPFGQRHVFAGSFLSGGEWPGGRKCLIAGGHAFYRVGAARKPIEKAKSGVVIPNEMVQGATAHTFESIGLKELGEKVAYQLERMSKGAIT